MTTRIVMLRSTLAVACAMALVACGGKSTMVSIGGSVTGLQTTGLVLAAGNLTVTIPANATSYVFPVQVVSDANYTIAVLNQPTDLTCSIANATGLTGASGVSNANVSCIVSKFKLGGSVSGLAGGELKLANGSDVATIAANAGSFVFPKKVSNGLSYGVTILSKPADLTCNIVNGIGTMGAADYLNIQVNCNKNS